MAIRASVVVPVYNKAPYLTDCFESIFAQSFTEFEVIATKLLTARGKELTEQQNEKLGTILRPLHDKLKDFEEQVRKAYETEGKERHLLKSEVAKLVEQNLRLSKDADNLTKALKGDSQAQGAWGERQQAGAPRTSSGQRCQRGLRRRSSRHRRRTHACGVCGRDGAGRDRGGQHSTARRAGPRADRRGRGR